MMGSYIGKITASSRQVLRGWVKMLTSNFV